jgi:hypothetical protein
MHASTLKPAFICGRSLLLVLTAAYPRFTPSCFWNALSVCKNKRQGQQRPAKQQPASMARKSHLFCHLECLPLQRLNWQNTAREKRASSAKPLPL